MARQISHRPHFIRGNESSRVPRRWFYLDTEALETRQGTTRTQTWRLAVTCYDRYDSDTGAWRDPEWRTHQTPEDLWAYVDTMTKAKTRTVVMAHNMGYDLRISQALFVLPTLGWSIDQMAMGSRQLTMTWRRGSRSLVMVDSMSWWPMALVKLGQLVGLDKPPLPDWEDTDALWEARCTADVEILQRANRELLDWIDGADLGNWQKSGAGMAWANWRHSHYTNQVLVHADDDAREAEIAAVATARTEAWRWGKHDSGPYTEWDLPMAYPWIAREIRVPTQLQGHVFGPTLAWLRKLPTYRRALVRATVTTDTPTLPLRVDGYWSWPVGTFTGWWWDTELLNAADHGADVDALEAITYQASMALADWATWVMGVADGSGGEYTPLQRATAKHWSRALIGRFGAKYPIWINYGEAPEPGLELNDLIDTSTGQYGKAMTMGDRLYLGLDEAYVADACPAIMGAIMAECRVRLWQVTQVAGPDNVLYMDTDSVITNPTGTAALVDWTDQAGGWGLRPKANHAWLEIHGPRQVILERTQKMAGVPRTARRTSSNTWTGELWEGVEQALREGRPDRVIVRSTSWTVKPLDRRRTHLEGGYTRPHQVEDA